MQSQVMPMFLIAAVNAFREHGLRLLPKQFPNIACRTFSLPPRALSLHTAGESISFRSRSTR
jgi:hypothetical protein